MCYMAFSDEPTDATRAVLKLKSLCLQLQLVKLHKENGSFCVLFSSGQGDVRY